MTQKQLWILFWIIEGFLIWFLFTNATLGFWVTWVLMMLVVILINLKESR